MLSQVYIALIPTASHQSPIVAHSKTFLHVHKLHCSTLTLASEMVAATALSAQTATVLRKASALRSRRHARALQVSVRAQIEDSTTTPTVTEVASTSEPAAPVAAAAQAVAVPLENQELFTVMGPLQEAINGRSAMLGFVTAFALERITHQSVMSQLGGRYVDGELVEKALGASDLSFAFVVAVVTLATFAPLVYKGEKPGSRAFGPFTPDLETALGRVAQLGFLSLVTVEILKGNTPLF